MATIEITGPDDKGQYTVEAESDQAEASEQSSAGGEAAEGSAGDSDTGGQSVTCGSIKEVLQAVKQLLQGDGASSPQDMWNQEAAAKAGAQQPQGAM